MISREEQQQAMKKLKRMISELKADIATFNHPLSRQLVHTLSVAVDCLEMALSQHERPKGRWVEVYDLDWLKFIWSCDQCGENAPTKPESCDQILKPFCPNCGAFMRGEEE